VLRYMEDKEQDMLLDEHTREIIEYMPNALQRWGVFVVAAVLVALFAGSYFIRYPETLKGRVVIPVAEDGRDTIAIMYVEATNIGEVRVGSKVLIFTEEYPEAKYGFLRGRVINLCGIPDENGLFKIEVSLPDGLTTSYGQSLSSQIQLSGTGEIIIREKCLLETIVKPLKIDNQNKRQR